MKNPLTIKRQAISDAIGLGRQWRHLFYRDCARKGGTQKTETALKKQTAPPGFNGLVEINLNKYILPT